MIHFPVKDSFLNYQTVYLLAYIESTYVGAGSRIGFELGSMF
jgi:hypothetical protein